MLNRYFKSWIPVIKNRFLSEIDFLANTLTNRVLSSFDSIYQEADQVQKEKYENALNSGYPDEDFDYADFVDTGLDEAVDYISCRRNKTRGDQFVCSAPLSPL